MTRSGSMTIRSWLSDGLCREGRVSARLAGTLLIALAAVVCLIYQALVDWIGVNRTAGHILLGFPTVILAAFGILLLIHGERLRGEWRRRCFDVPPTPVPAAAGVDQASGPGSRADRQTALAALLALSAIRRAGSDRPVAFAPDLVRHLRPRRRRRRA